MNILLSTYPEAFVRPGGGEVELLNISSHLTSMPILNQIYSYTTCGVKSYTHFIHFSTVPSGIDLARKIFQESTPLTKKYLWPLFWPARDTRYNFDFMDIFDAVIFKSKIEYEIFRDNTSQNFKPIFINDFIDRVYMKKNIQFAGIFSEVFNLEFKRFHLWVGVIDRSKKQLDFIKTIQNSRERYVFIGGASDPEYLSECKYYGRNNCLFIDNLNRNSDLLISAYVDCETYVEFTDSIPGASAIEALSQGCEVNIYDSDWVCEVVDRLKIIKIEKPLYSEMLGKKVVSLKVGKFSESLIKEYSIENQMLNLINQIE